MDEAGRLENPSGRNEDVVLMFLLFVILVNMALSRMTFMTTFCASFAGALDFVINRKKNYLSFSQIDILFQASELKRVISIYDRLAIGADSERRK